LITFQIHKEEYLTLLLFGLKLIISLLQNHSEFISSHLAVIFELCKLTSNHKFNFVVKVIGVGHKGISAKGIFIHFAFTILVQ
jgi:hypothetical protein